MAAAVLPPISTHDESFPVHIGQHLRLGLIGPAVLALSAPVTMARRALPPRPRRALLWLLHIAPAVVLSAPAAAVLLDIRGLYALYLTGLYSAAERNDLVHAAPWTCTSSWPAACWAGPSSALAPSAAARSSR